MSELNAEALRDRLDYDAETGVFRWVRGGKGRYPNAVAGCARPDGYVRINVAGKFYYAHRLAWLYVTGEWPQHQVDHINGDPNDNRWENLRQATPRQNRGNKGVQSNSLTGVKGVTWNAKEKRWIAYLSPNGKFKRIGSFRNLEDAKRARSEAAREFFGEFSRDE